jgi:hypothetical protein
MGSQGGVERFRAEVAQEQAVVVRRVHDRGVGPVDDPDRGPIDRVHEHVLDPQVVVRERQGGRRCRRPGLEKASTLRRYRAGIRELRVA